MLFTSVIVVVVVVVISLWIIEFLKKKWKKTMRKLWIIIMNYERIINKELWEHHLLIYLFHSHGQQLYKFLRTKWSFYIDLFHNGGLLYLTNGFHVAVRLFSNRSQMTSKGCKTKKWHTSRRRACDGCFCHILTTDPRPHRINLFYTMIRKEKRPIHIPDFYRLTVWGFVLV